MQISTIFRQLEGMTTQTQITCAIRREQMMKGMACTTNLFKQLPLTDQLFNIFFSSSCYCIWFCSCCE